MPPRFAYWTILIDNAPTAFRARDREELLPTLTQLKRTNQNVELKWFAQGRLWDSPEAQRASWEKPRAPGERRDRGWRPGGAHKDPRARFDKEAQRRKKREQRAEWNAKPRPPRERPPHGDAARRDRAKLGPPPAGGQRPWRDKPAGPPRGDRPWKGGPPRPPSQRFSGPGADRPSRDRPPRDRNSGGGGWKPKTGGPGGARKPWSGKPRAERKPWQHKPAGAPQRRDDEPPDKDR